MKQDVILIFFPNKQMILESWKKMLFFLLYNISHCFPFQTMSLDKANWTLAREAERILQIVLSPPFHQRLTSHLILSLMEEVYQTWLWWRPPAWLFLPLWLHLCWITQIPSTPHTPLLNFVPAAYPIVPAHNAAGFPWESSSQ